MILFTPILIVIVYTQVARQNTLLYTTNILKIYASIYKHSHAYMMTV